jgi:ArsR family transcriptional regulator
VRAAATSSRDQRLDGEGVLTWRPTIPDRLMEPISGSWTILDEVELVTQPKKKRSRAAPPCEPLVHPKVEVQHAEQLAAVSRALGDPVRLQIVDVLHHHAGAVCVCEINDLFDLSQSTVSHHLKVLRQAGIVDYEKRGLWAFYYVKREVIEELGRWLLEGPGTTPEEPGALPMAPT